MHGKRRRISCLEQFQVGEVYNVVAQIKPLLLRNSRFHEVPDAHSDHSRNVSYLPKSRCNTPFTIISEAQNR